MKSIQIDKNKILRKFDNGIESIIYYYDDNGKIVLLKHFNDEIFIDDRFVPITQKTLSNKEKKIEIIKSSPLFNNEVKILDKAYEDDKFKGYTLEKSNLTVTSCFQKRKAKIKILKELRNKIELFNQNGIFLGDIHEGNILTNKDGSEIQLCDLDNLRINDLDFDVVSVAVNRFNKKCSKKEFVDSYSFNLFTISLLEKIYAPHVLEHLKEHGLPRILNTKENREIMDSIINLDNSYQKKYLIDYMK